MEENDKIKRKVSKPTPLNENLRRTREELGLSRREVARAIGYKDNKMIAWYENTGATLPYEKLVTFARLYNKSIDELFGLDVRTDDNIEKVIIYKNGNNSIIEERTKGAKKSCFHVMGEGLTKKRIATLKALIENPTIIDCVDGILNHK